jgi:hypothetical protein
MSDIADVQTRDDPPTIADEAYVAQTEGEPTGSPSVTPKRGRGILKRVGLTLLTLVAVVIVAAFLLFNFGGMERPTPEVRAQYDALVASGKASPVPAAGFHLPIPGCKCHSSDPVQQMKHAGLAIKDCSKCHGGGADPEAQAASAGY